MKGSWGKGKEKGGEKEGEPVGANVDQWEKEEPSSMRGMVASKWRCLVCRAAPSVG